MDAANDTSCTDRLTEPTPRQLVARYRQVVRVGGTDEADRWGWQWDPISGQLEPVTVAAGDAVALPATAGDRSR